MSKVYTLDEFADAFMLKIEKLEKAIIEDMKLFESIRRDAAKEEFKIPLWETKTTEDYEKALKKFKKSKEKDNGMRAAIDKRFPDGYWNNITMASFTDLEQPGYPDLFKSINEYAGAILDSELDREMIISLRDVPGVSNIMSDDQDTYLIMWASDNKNQMINSTIMEPIRLWYTQPYMMTTTIESFVRDWITKQFYNDNVFLIVEEAHKVQAEVGEGVRDTVQEFYEPLGVNPFSPYVKSNNYSDRDLAALYYEVSAGRRAMPRPYAENPLYREENSYYDLRIGDFLATIPPEIIHLSSQTNTPSVQGIRSRNSTQIHAGYKLRVLRMSLFFNGLVNINGKKTASPFSSKTKEDSSKDYYMHGLAALIAQFKRAPFLPIVNEYVNNVLNIHNVALSNINLSTVPDFPGCIEAELTLIEIDTSVYTEMPDELYGNFIDWDIFRYYYQETIQDRLKLIPSNTLIENLELSFLDSDALKGVKDNRDFNETFNLFNDNNYITYDLKSYPMSIIDMTASFSNTLPSIQLNGQSSPTLQYMGSSDERLSVVIETKSRELCSLVEFITDYTNKTARENPRYAGIGFVKINNEIANLIGITHCTIQECTISTVPDFPGLFRISIDIMSYDINQKEKGAIKGFSPFPDIKEMSVTNPENAKEVLEYLMAQTIPFNTDGLYTKIVQDNYAEDMLSYMELYPDLDLPRYKDVDAAIKLINIFRENNGFSRLPYESYPKEKGMTDIHYVDPDFYVMYPADYSKTETKWLDPNYVAKELFGKEMNIKKEWNTKVIGRVEGIFKSNDEVGALREETMVVDKETIDLNEFGKPIKSLSPLSRHVAAEDMFQEDRYETERRFVDMVQFNKRGRMVRAFPTYLFVVIDESSQILDGRRLWNNYYVINNMIESSVHATRYTGVSTMVGVFKNVYGNLSKARAQTDWMNKSSNWFKRELGLWFGTPKLTDKMLIDKIRIFDSINLKAGARIHYRKGYGSDVRKLPIVFNGTITEIQNSEVIEITAQSDAIELHNSMVENKSEKKTNSVFKLGTEPSDIIGNLLSNRESFISHINSNYFEGNAFGIEHFGLFIFGFRNDKVNKNNLKIEHSKGDGPSTITITDPRALDSGKYPSRKAYNAAILGEYATDRTSRFFMGTATAGFAVALASATPVGGTIASVIAISEAARLSTFMIAKNLSYSEMMKTMNNPFTDYLLDFDRKDSVDNSKYNNYDLIKNIYLSSSDYKKTSLYGQSDDKKWEFDGEEKLRSMLLNNTAGDLMAKCANLVPEYIYTPVFHQFESRIFYGLPTWGCKYRYDTVDTGSSVRVDESSKPLSQIHYLDSYSDIIHNSIKATSRGVATNIISTYVRGSSLKTTPSVFADRKIDGDKQRNKILDSSYQSPLFKDMFNRIFNTNNTAKNKAIQISVSALMDGFRHAYDGELLIIGDSSIKPYDCIFLSDEYSSMNGQFTVREVTHLMNATQGFTTSIVPDMVSFSNLDGKSGMLNAHLNATSALLGVMGVKAVRWSGIRTLRNIKKSVDTIKTTAGIVGTYVDSINTGKAITGAVDTVKKGTVFAKGVSTSANAVKAKAVVSGAAAGPIGSLVAWVAATIMIDYVLTGIIDYVRLQNCIKILPLYHNGLPYIAGFNGHERLLLGGNPLLDIEVTLDERQKIVKEALDMLSKAATGQNDTGNKINEKYFINFGGSAL